MYFKMKFKENKKKQNKLKIINIRLLDFFLRLDIISNSFVFMIFFFFLDSINWKIRMGTFYIIITNVIKKIHND
jgi:hypothetical protein